MAKNKLKSKQKTYVMFVLDESGSMQNGKDITINSFNEQVGIVRANADKCGETFVSFITFSDNVSPIYMNKHPDNLIELDDTNYDPDGWTALYDAVGFGIEELRKEEGVHDKDSAVLVVVLTDGDDNKSFKWNSHKLGSAIEDLQATGKWTFTVMGPKKGVSLLAKSLSIPTGNVAGFDPSSIADRTIARSMMANSLTSYTQSRSTGTLQASAFYADANINKNVGEHSTTLLDMGDK